MLGIVLADAGALGRAGAVGVGLCGVLLSRSRGSLLRRCGAVCLFAALGAHAMSAQLDCAATRRIERPRRALLEGRVVEVVSRVGGIDITLQRVRAVSGAALPPRLRLGLAAAAKLPGRFLPGDQLRLWARVRPPEGRANPGRPDSARRWARAVVTLDDPANQVHVPKW